MIDPKYYETIPFLLKFDIDLKKNEIINTPFNYTNYLDFLKKIVVLKVYAVFSSVFSALQFKLTIVNVKLIIH